VSDVAEIASRFWSPELWVNTTILLTLGRVLWVAVGKLTESALFRLSLRTQKVSFTLSARGDRPAEITSLNVLFIRHGSDDYLRNLASDQEKHHGRLRNKTRRIKTRTDADGNIIVAFDVDVHKRIGTQFKLFVDVQGDLEPVLDYLKSHDNVYDIGVSSNPNAVRVFFLLRDFAETKTVDGFTNNMIWPV
jgi:hypothetical protein